MTKNFNCISTFKHFATAVVWSCSGGLNHFYRHVSLKKDSDFNLSMHTVISVIVCGSNYKHEGTNKNKTVKLKIKNGG